MRRGGRRCRGSSPRGRGKLARRRVPAQLSRLIPARAGKTCVGDDERLEAAGSSPRGRGKRRSCYRSWASVRLIPARAGKTGGHARPLSGDAAHPRAGGENGRTSRPSFPVAGSSPRGRGKHFLTCAFIERIGQILETLELAVSSGSYSVWVACATDAPQDQVRSIGLVLPSSRGAS